MAVVAWHLSACRGCGRQRASLACLVAPRGAPGLVRSGRSRWSGRLSGRRGGLPHPGFTGRLRGARGGQPRIRLIVPDAGPRRGGGAGLAPRRTRAGPRNGVVPGGSLRRWSWAACAALFGLCGPGHCRVVFPIPSVVRRGTRPVHLACFVWTPKPLLLGRRTPRLGPVPVCVCVLSWPGRAGPPFGRVLVSLPFSCGPSWCSLRLLGPLRAGVALLVVVDVFFVFLFFSFSSRPPCLLPFLFSGPGCPETWPFAPPPLFCFFFFFFFLPPLPFFFLPVFVFFFLLRLFFFCRGMLVVRCSVLLCPGLWSVLVCVVVGFVLRLGLLCACNPSFGAPCLCLLPLCWCLLCCACPVAPCWRRCSSPCRLCWVPFGVACSLPPRVFCAGRFFSACRVFAGSAPPPPGLLWCPLLCFVVRPVVWCCGLWCVLCCVACLRWVGFLRRVVWRGVVLCPVFVVLCCRALLRSLLVFFLRCSVPFRGAPPCFCFCAPLVRCCAGVSASLPSVRCSLAPAALAGVSLPGVFAGLLLGLAVLCCLLVGPGGSWRRVSVVCCVVSLGAVLRRVAARCAAWRCVVVRCVVLFCSVCCCRALCRVLWRCPSSWGPVPSGAVFCLVSPRCVCSAVVCWCVVLFAVLLCAACVLGRPAVCSLPSPPCAVLLCGPALPWCPALPCCAPWCSGAVWCCSVLSCCLVWFASCVCLVSPT